MALVSSYIDDTEEIDWVKYKKARAEFNLKNQIYVLPHMFF